MHDQEGVACISSVKTKIGGAEAELQERQRRVPVSCGFCYSGHVFWVLNMLAQSLWIFKTI